MDTAHADTYARITYNYSIQQHTDGRWYILDEYDAATYSVATRTEAVALAHKCQASIDALPY